MEGGGEPISFHKREAVKKSAQTCTLGGEE